MNLSVLTKIVAGTKMQEWVEGHRWIENNVVVDWTKDELEGIKLYKSQ